MLGGDTGTKVYTISGAYGFNQNWTRWNLDQITENMNIRMNYTDTYEYGNLKEWVSSALVHIIFIAINLFVFDST